MLLKFSKFSNFCRFQFRQTLYRIFFVVRDNSYKKCTNKPCLNLILKAPHNIEILEGSYFQAFSRFSKILPTRQWFLELKWRGRFPSNSNAQNQQFFFPSRNEQKISLPPLIPSTFAEIFISFPVYGQSENSRSNYAFDQCFEQITRSLISTVRTPPPNNAIQRGFKKKKNSETRRP